MIVIPCLRESWRKHRSWQISLGLYRKKGTTLVVISPGPLRPGSFKLWASIWVQIDLEVCPNLLPAVLDAWWAVDPRSYLGWSGWATLVESFLDHVRYRRSLKAPITTYRSATHDISHLQSENETLHLYFVPIDSLRHIFHRLDPSNWDKKMFRTSPDWIPDCLASYFPRPPSHPATLLGHICTPRA